MHKADLFDDRGCSLGEGVFWHPLRQQWFWFDILNKKLLSTDGWEHQFNRYVSAMGWIDKQTVLIATSTDLIQFNLETKAETRIVELEADQKGTRSNDGRADPYGGFWIGTMGLNADRDAGAIYRYYRGEFEELYAPITIPNSICFSPDGSTAYFTDTPSKMIQSVKLDDHGWPCAEPKLHINLYGTDLNPDGSVVDADGNLWNAQWGASRVAAYDPKGKVIATLEVGGAHASCPGFGGPELDHMLVTTAQQGRKPIEAGDGQTFLAKLDGVKGQAEHQVILG